MDRLALRVEQADLLAHHLENVRHLSRFVLVARLALLQMGECLIEHEELREQGLGFDRLFQPLGSLPLQLSNPFTNQRVALLQLGCAILGIRLFVASGAERLGSGHATSLTPGVDFMPGILQGGHFTSLCDNSTVRQWEIMLGSTGNRCGIP